MSSLGHCLSSSQAIVFALSSRMISFWRRSILRFFSAFSFAFTISSMIILTFSFLATLTGTSLFFAITFSFAGTFLIDSNAFSTTFSFNFLLFTLTSVIFVLMCLWGSCIFSWGIRVFQRYFFFISFFFSLFLSFRLFLVLFLFFRRFYFRSRAFSFWFGFRILLRLRFGLCRVSIILMFWSFFRNSFRLRRLSSFLWLFEMVIRVAFPQSFLQIWDLCMLWIFHEMFAALNHFRHSGINSWRFIRYLLVLGSFSGFDFLWESSISVSFDSN